MNDPVARPRGIKKVSSVADRPWVCLGSPHTSLRYPSCRAPLPSQHSNRLSKILLPIMSALHQASYEISPVPLCS